MPVGCSRSEEPAQYRQQRYRSVILRRRDGFHPCSFGRQTVDMADDILARVPMTTPYCDVVAEDVTFGRIAGVSSKSLCSPSRFARERIRTFS